jgi:hypothetical protein
MHSFALTRARLAGALVVFAAGTPVGAQIMVSSPSVVEQTTHPGGRYTGTIIVQNTSAVAQRITARVVDYSFEADGTSRYDDPGSQPRSSARWIALSPRTTEIPPRKSVALAYTIQVPAIDTLTGSYSSMVLVTSPLQNGDVMRPHGGRANAGIKSDMSYGIQLATHLGGAAPSRFAMGQLMTGAGTGRGRNLALTVRNTGARAQRPIVSIELYTEDGRLVASQKAQRGLIYPGSSVRQTFTLPSVPRGSYRALLQTDTGEDIFAMQARVSF